MVRVLILVFGLFPGLIFNVTDPAVQANISECLTTEIDSSVKADFDIGLCEREGIDAALTQLNVATSAKAGE